MISLETENEVIRLRGLDYSFDKIANTLDISKPKVMEICNQSASDIDIVRREQVDNMLDEQAHTTQERSKLYRELIGKVHAEILSRDIKEVSTERLFMMLERLECSLANLEPKTYANDPFAEFENMSDDDLKKIIQVPLIVSDIGSTN